MSKRIPISVSVRAHVREDVIERLSADIEAYANARFAELAGQLLDVEVVRADD